MFTGTIHIQILAFQIILINLYMNHHYFEKKKAILHLLLTPQKKKYFYSIFLLQKFLAQTFVAVHFHCVGVVWQGQFQLAD